jgi:S-methylmethionine-dependent homocysteine/selenocysteine methylase
MATLLASRPFLTFAGIETYLLFLQGFPLREFCAFELADDESAWQAMERTFLRPIADAAARHGFGLITDSLVWRASTDYVTRLGHTAKGVIGVNRQAVARMRRSVDDWRAASGVTATTCPIVLAGDLGPRGDGYALAAGGPVPIDAAHAYHLPQVEALAEAGIDLLVALTMTSANEAIGVVQAAEEHGLPVLVSPTVETDGTIPDGSPLGDFIATVDDATGGYPAGFMVNCAHPLHLEPALRTAADAGAGWLGRFRGLRANASTKSHAELDEATELDRGDVADLAARLAAMRARYGLTVLGGCCGTDAEHLRAIAARCA